MVGFSDKLVLLLVLIGLDIRFIVDTKKLRF